MTKAIQHYLDGEPKGLTLEVILRTRYDVQHRILSLPPITDLPVLEFPFTYEACRLGGLIYSIAVLLPIPNSCLVLKELVQQVQTAIEMSRLETALDKPERYCDVDKILERYQGEHDQKADEFLSTVVLVLETVWALMQVHARRRSLPTCLRYLYEKVTFHLSTWHIGVLAVAKWLQWNREHGKISQAWNGPFSRIIYIGDPDMIFKITTANWPKSSLQYDVFQPLSGDALFVQTIHEIWRVQRKRVAPAFQPQVIDQQYSYVTKHLLSYIRLLDVAAETHTIRDISTLNILLTLLHWRSSVRHRSPSLISRPKMIFEILAKQREEGGSYTFSSKELCDNYIAFLVAGSRPNRSHHVFRNYEMLRHPRVLKQLRAEIDANIPYDVKVPSLEQIKLPNLVMVLSSQQTPHLLCGTQLHRDARLWDDPDSFDPERSRSGKPHIRGAYFPFSHGPQNCIG
ncbi:hypothetical protein WAI453_011218 [Rhynchosporium graminicola]